MNKDTYPGLLDASVGGHVDLNSNYDDAALKELEEETGIKTNRKDLVYTTKMRTKSYDQSTGMTNNTFRAVYAYQYNDVGKIKIEKDKAISLEFWPIDKILNPSPEDKKKFIPFLLSDKCIEIFKEIKKHIESAKSTKN